VQRGLVVAEIAGAGVDGGRLVGLVAPVDEERDARADGRGVRRDTARGHAQRAAAALVAQEHERGVVGGHDQVEVAVAVGVRGGQAAGGQRPLDPRARGRRVHRLPARDVLVGHEPAAPRHVLEQLVRLPDAQHGRLVVRAGVAVGHIGVDVAVPVEVGHQAAPAHVAHRALREPGLHRDVLEARHEAPVARAVHAVVAIERVGLQLPVREQQVDVAVRVHVRGGQAHAAARVVEADEE
jgi:hypothetical protein